MLLVMLYWLTSGKARLKQKIARRTVLDFEVLPLQKEFVEFLHNETKSGQTLYLATALIAVWLNRLQNGWGFSNKY